MYEHKKKTFPLYCGILLIIYIGACLFLFFIDTSKGVKTTIESNLTNNIKIQSSSVEKLFSQQEKMFESMADYISYQPNLVDSSLLNFIDSFAQNSVLSRIYIIDSSGQAYLNNGETYDVSEKEYFIRAMQGNKTIAQPVNSIIGNEYRIVFTVPIQRDGTVIGVIGGSFNMSDMKKMVFYSSEYETKGYSLIMNSEGNLITVEDDKVEDGTYNFFEYYKGATFLETSVEDVNSYFKSEQSHSFKIKFNEEELYVTIAPIGINDWFIGSVIPVEELEKEFAFVSENEVILFIEIGSGFVIYLLYVLSVTKKQQRNLMKKASIDQLTGFYNKLSMQRITQKIIDQEEAFSMLLLDLDDFKNINDTYGHFVGDQVLIAVSSCIKDTLRKNDIIGRVGGDEIMIVLRGMQNEKMVCKKCDDLITAIASYEFKQNFKVSCSIGVVYYPNDATSFNELYKKADDALYKAKASGKCKYYEYEQKDVS